MIIDQELPSLGSRQSSWILQSNSIYYCWRKRSNCNYQHGQAVVEKLEKWYNWQELFYPHLTSVQDLLLSFCLLLTHTSIHCLEILNFLSDLDWTCYLLPPLPKWALSITFYSWKPTPHMLVHANLGSNSHDSSYLFTLTSSFSSMANSHSRYLYIFLPSTFPVPHLYCAGICPHFPLSFHMQPLGILRPTIHSVLLVTWLNYS